MAGLKDVISQVVRHLDGVPDIERLSLVSRGMRGALRQSVGIRVDSSDLKIESLTCLHRVFPGITSLTLSVSEAHFAWDVRSPIPTLRELHLHDADPPYNYIEIIDIAIDCIKDCYFNVTTLSIDIESYRLLLDRWPAWEEVDGFEDPLMVKTDRFIDISLTNLTMIGIELLDLALPDLEHLTLGDIRRSSVQMNRCDRLTLLETIYFTTLDISEVGMLDDRSRQGHQTKLMAVRVDIIKAVTSNTGMPLLDLDGVKEDRRFVDGVFSPSRSGDFCYISVHKLLIKRLDDLYIFIWYSPRLRELVIDVEDIDTRYNKDGLTIGEDEGLTHIIILRLNVIEIPKRRFGIPQSVLYLDVFTKFHSSVIDYLLEHNQNLSVRLLGRRKPTLNKYGARVTYVKEIPREFLTTDQN